MVPGEGKGWFKSKMTSSDSHAPLCLCYIRRSGYAFVCESDIPKLKLLIHVIFLCIFHLKRYRVFRNVDYSSILENTQIG